MLASFIFCVSLYRVLTDSLWQADVAWIEILIVAALVGAMGAADDVVGLSPKLRLLLQCVFSLASIYATHPLATSGIPFFENLPLWIITPVGWFGLMWWLNLYNFMDGLDGLASSQTIHMAICGLTGILLVLSIQGESIGQIAQQWPGPELLILAACSLGFLVLNWHPARIFLGDAGSLSQAYILYMLAISSIAMSQLTYQFWLIAGASFVLDASYTLAQRIKHKAKLSQAHREHTYQKLFDGTALKQNHVALVYVLWNSLILLPISLISLVFKDYADSMLVFAYAGTLAAMLYARKVPTQNT